MRIYDLAGWAGVVTILAAYMLLTTGVMDSEHLGYIFMNIIGAAALIVSSLPKKDLQPVALNSIWMIIAIFSLIQAFN